MPLIKRPGSPYWQLHIGRSYRKSTGTADYEKAEEIERVVTEQLWRREKLGDRGAVPWREAAERWLRGSARAKKRDREILEWLDPLIGIEQVADIDPDAIEQLREKGLACGWSHSTVDRAMGTLSAVLHACVAWRYIDTAPAIPMYRPARGEPRWLTPAELDRLCWHLPMHLALAARFAVTSLLRMRAQARLTWSRVDMKAARAWIPSAHQKAARTFGLPLSSEALRVLRAARMAGPPASPFVFTWAGRPVDDFNGTAFQKGVKRAKLDPLRWHDLRHTGASWAVQSGVTLPELMVLGDWKDYRSVLVYAHLAPSHAAAAAEKVAQWSHAQQHKRG